MKLLICLDRSNATEKVLRAAKAKIVSEKEPLYVRIVHIIDETLANSIDGADNYLKTVLKNRSQEIKRMSESNLQMEINYEEERGVPKEKILEILAKDNYDLVMVGSHGRSELKHSLMGSFAEITLKHSHKPVIIVPTI